MNEIVTQLIIFVAGLAMLVLGADKFIQGAARVARKIGVSPFVIGLTLVGFGTSAPELVVNISAALKDNTELAIGNIVGSNIANIGLILGMAAIMKPVTAERKVLKLEVPLMILVCGAFWGMSLDGYLNPTDGLILLIGFLALMILMVRTGRASSADVEEQMAEPGTIADKNWVSILLVVVGLVGLLIGAELMVRSAVKLATIWGVSETVIGLTIVAVGTSLPELAATVTAAIRGESDIALGNIVGSNLFNVLLVIGVTTQITRLTVSDSVIRIDMPIMFGFCLAVIIVPLIFGRYPRWSGIVLLASYLLYLGWQATIVLG